MTRASPLADLLDVHAALRADQHLPLEQKRARDRKIGAALSDHRRAPARQLRGWLDLVQLGGWQRAGSKAVQWHHLLTGVLALFGLVTGWGLAQVVLHYTGDAPINIINALAVLILPQLLLLLFWLAAMAPVRIPLVHGVRSSLQLLNPGRLAGLLARRARAGGQLDVLWDPEQAIVFAPVARWLVSFWSQCFSVAFNIGALLAVLYLISFSDLAFGWSTTLNLANETFHRWIEALAWPWHALFPQGVPSAELVQASRYFRLETATAGAVEDVASLGGWWPFLVAALICYGLLPRVITLLISWQRLHHHLRAAVPRLPGAPELLARMNSPLVRTAATRPETVAAEPTVSPLTLETGHGQRLRCPLVAWSGSIAALDDIKAGLQTLGIEPTALLHAGGSRTTEQDASTVETLCRQREQGVAVVAKVWEPPLLEFMDFVRAMRRHCTRRQPIVVLLRDGARGEHARDAEVWNLTLQRLRDPDLHVELLP